MEDFEGLCAALSWQPDPAEVDLAGGGRRERGGDIIAMLVAIYGSKELFINEYRWRCAPQRCSLGIHVWR